MAPPVAGFLLFDISQYFQHALCGLLFCVNPVNQLSIFIMLNDNMLWRRDKTVFNSPITTDLILICSGVKKTDIQRLFSVCLWQKYFVDMFLRVIIIMAV